MLHGKPILDHHSTFFDCSLNKPAVEEQTGISEGDTIVLPAQTGIVHCHLQSNQFLTVFQPRFEEGAVYRCTSNGLHLSVCECTDLILFLTGKINVFDLFKTAPKGRIVATWPTDSEVYCQAIQPLQPPLFFRSIAASSATEADGYIVVSYRHSPCQIHYIGPHKPQNLYLVQLRDSVDILLYKYGGQPSQIHPTTAPQKEYTVKYSFGIPLRTDAEASVVGIAIQHNSSVIRVESPFTRALSEVGCALWRLAQSAAAKLDLLQAHPCVNCCHSELARLPLILIEGHHEGTCLTVCPSTARALCGQEQAEVWAVQNPHALCILFVCQTNNPDPSDFHHLVTITPEEHGALPALPTADSAISAFKESLQATPIDSCPSLATANGWYVCICGEPALTVFWGAQALLNQQ